MSEQELAIGLCGVAAPIRDGSRTAIAAINVSGPITTISRKRLLNELMPAVVHAAAQISLGLGYSPSP
jgi:IclR family pca regulon transcriptional regulator